MTEKKLDRMVEIEAFVGRLTSFLAANKVRLMVSRKSDTLLTSEDEVVYLVFDEDDTVLRVTEHGSNWMETFIWYPGLDRPQGPRVTGHDSEGLIDKIGYIAT